MQTYVKIKLKIEQSIWTSLHGLGDQMLAQIKCQTLQLSGILVSGGF